MTPAAVPTQNATRPSARMPSVVPERNFRHDVDERVGHRVRDTGDRGPHFLREVAEHERADERHGVLEEERAKEQHDEREADLLDLRDRAERRHLDGALGLRRESVHDRRLDDRDERHVGVRRDRDCTEQVGREAAREPDRRRAVGAADDADRGRRLHRGDAAEEVSAKDGRETERTEEREEDAELRGTAEERHLGVGDQWAKVGHRADAHEDHDREDARVDAELEEVVQEPAGLDDSAGHHRNARRQHRYHAVVHHRGSRHARERAVGEKSAEANREEQQRLKALHDRKVHHDEAERDHDKLADAVRHAEERLDFVTLDERAKVVEVAADPLARSVIVAVRRLVAAVRVVRILASHRLRVDSIGLGVVAGDVGGRFLLHEAGDTGFGGKRFLLHEAGDTGFGGKVLHLGEHRLPRGDVVRSGNGRKAASRNEHCHQNLFHVL